MAANLMWVLEQSLGSNEVLSRIGSLIGLSPEKAKSAVGAAVPAILAALVSLVQKPAGRDQLATAVRNHDPGVLDNLSGMLGGGRETGLISEGSSALSSLLGQGTLGSLAGALGRFAGLNQGSATSLLGALAPVVLGALGREQRTQNLDAQGLAGMLNDQKDSIADALPTGLAGELGSTGLLDGIADRLSAGASTTAEAARTARADAARTASVAPSTGVGTAGPAATGVRPRTLGRRLLASVADRSHRAAGVDLAGLAVPVPRSDGGGGRADDAPRHGRRAGAEPGRGRRQCRPGGHKRVRERDRGAQ